MHLVIDHTTRFFTVVGAPYIPEHHLDACLREIETGAADRRPHPGEASETCSTGWWPHDEH